MIGYNCLSHNSYVNIEHDTDRRNQIYDLIIQSSEFNKYPCCTREDFFDYLIESGNTIEDAFKISELIRKGRANNSDFNDFQMPEELNTLAKRYTYIFPRAHVIEYSLINARLAYYMKQDSKTYSKIVFKNNKHKY